MRHWLRLSLTLAGLLTLIVNLGLTPLLPRDQGFAAVAASSAFLWRQSLSAVASICLVLGASDILFQRDNNNPWRIGAALLAVVGSTVLMGQEWGEIFIVRTLAVEAPATLIAMDTRPGMSAYDAGAIIAFTLFATGWIALALAEALTRRPKLPPLLVVLSFILTPVLTPLVHRAAPIVVAAVLGVGWMWWGLARYRSTASDKGPMGSL